MGCTKRVLWVGSWNKIVCGFCDVGVVCEYLWSYRPDFAMH
jgi:hypothetical protein